MSKRIEIPDSSDDVLRVMKEYASKRGFQYTDTELEIIAEDCFLYFQSRGWKSGSKVIAYWPAVAMRWLLNNAKRDRKLPLKRGPNLRKRLMGEE